MEALIIIDVQNGLIEKNLYQKEHYNSKTLKYGSNEWEIYSGLNKIENDIIIQKRHGSIFKETNLKQLLKENKIKNIIICGLVSNGCVYFSCKDGIDNGFNAKLIKTGHSNWLKDAENKINEVNNELENIGIKII